MTDLPPRHGRPGPGPVLSLRNPRDLLAYLPYHFGFLPTDSLVVVALTGVRNTIGVTMRIDLPPTRFGVISHAASEAVSDVVRRTLMRDDAAGALLVQYTEDLHRYWSLVPSLEHDLRAVEIPVVDAFQVGQGRWFSLLCRGGGCCPEEGWPLTELDDSPIAAESVFRGLTVAPSREDRLVGLRCTDPALSRRVNGKARRRAIDPRDTAAMLGVLVTWRRLLELASENDCPTMVISEQDAGDILRGVKTLMLRDALLADTVLGEQHPQAVEAFLADSSEEAAALDRAFTGDVSPDPDRSQAARMVLRGIIVQSSGKPAADALAMLAWLTWWTGDVSLAGDVAGLALELNPNQSMAGLVLRMAMAGMPPGWVRARHADPDQAA